MECNLQGTDLGLLIFKPQHYACYTFLPLCDKSQSKTFRIEICLFRQEFNSTLFISLPIFQAGIQFCPQTFKPINAGGCAEL